MHKKNHNIIAVLLILIISIQLCGFGKPDIAIDTEKNRVYTYITADTLLNEFKTDKKNAQTKYKDKYLLVSGLFESADEKDGSFSIINNNRDYISLICTFDKNQSINVSDFDFMDNVAVYGKCSFLFGNMKLVEVKKIIPAPAVRSSEVYSTTDGTFFDKSASLERTLNNGKVKYYIPSKWKDIEVNIKEQEIGNIEGYQYVLNKTPGSSDTLPESLFVCYFDKKLLKESSDIKKTDRVEKAIIENIEGKVGSFPSHRATAYYGAKYQYYRGNFTDALAAGKGYHTEYVFQEDGDRGIIMFLYLYDEAKHISDVMITARLLEAAK